MSPVELFEWTFSPPDYFEQPLELVRAAYIMTITTGRVEVRLDSDFYTANPAIRDELHEALNDRFLGAQLVSFRPYELLGPVRTHLREDGGKDVFAEPKGVGMVFTVGTPDIQVTRADGTIVYDSRSERVAAKRSLGELIELHRPLSPTLTAMLNSISNAVRDPQNELVHLYEILDALSKEFGGKSRAIRTLGLDTSMWSRLGQICNNEPLRQGRHRGKMGLAIRDATHAELEEAREITRSMLRLYVQFL